MENFVFKDKDYYKREIIDMVGKIENAWILEVILRFIDGMTKED